MKDEAGSVNSFTKENFFLSGPIRLPHAAALISVTLPSDSEKDHARRWVA
jgi:hypothetical protein